MEEPKRGLRKTRVGIVVKDRMDKTVLVQVERMVMHARYKKYVRRRAKYMAHDERGDYRVGDRVEIMETRPLSRHKRWRILRLIERPEIK